MSTNTPNVTLTTITNILEKNAVELPFDVQAYVISFSHDNEALASCALVCRSWLPVARSSLYFSVRLGSERQWAAFERLFLEAGASDVGRYLGKVRQLYVTSSCASDDKGWEDTVVPRCTKYLTGLNTICIHDADLTLSLDSLIANPPKYDLVRLDLEDVTCRDELQVLQFMMLFPSLSSLTLRLMCLNECTIPSHSQISAASFRLKHLNFHNLEDYHTTLGELLSKIGALRSLTSLEWSEASTVNPLGLLGGICDSSLQTLDCTMDVPLKG